MCTELHLRFHPCTHTRFLRWDYCSVIIPSHRIPETGCTCRRYRRRYKEDVSGECWECVR
ncbi:hypothetical protein BDU57DRAFT_401943, partial [Ampelomyces quisqualis]